MDMETKQWTEVGISEDTQCGVPDLTPGHKYKFRVKAVNEEGSSDALETDSEILAKDPFGKAYVLTSANLRFEIQFMSNVKGYVLVNHHFSA